MKKTILTTAIMFSGFAFMSAGQLENKGTSKVDGIQNIKKENPVSKCYRAAVDDFGNTYYVRVKCPKRIILS